jgi:hypothetical protein
MSTAERTAERTAALRVILNPPDIAFFASLRPRGGKRKGSAGADFRQRRLIELVQGIGAGTLSIVCAGAHAPRRVKQSLKDGVPRCCRGLLLLA